MKLESLRDLLADELQTLVSIEAQVLQKLPSLKKSAFTRELADALADLAVQTKPLPAALKALLKQLARRPRGTAEPATKAILAACVSVVNRSPKGHLRDAALLALLQRLEHYRSAVYSSTLALAQQLGEDEVLEELKGGALQHELAAKHFTQISIQVNAEAFVDANSEQEAPVLKSPEQAV